MVGKLRMPLRYLNYRMHIAKPRCYPDRLYLESTNMCNLRCVMCPNGLGKMRRQKGFMDYGLFTQIIDEMAPRVSATTLHIWGEPLLHREIIRMIRYARFRGVRPELSTNATLLDRDTAEELLHAGLDVIYLCLDGTSKKDYERVRKGACFERTRANVKEFLHLKASKGLHEPWVALQLVDMSLTRATSERFREQWQLPGVDSVNIKHLDSWAGQVQEVGRLATETRALPEERWPCPNLWYHAHVYWDGALVCCDRDFDGTYPLGNVADGVMKAWNGEHMVELRRRHLANELAEVPACSKCIEWAWWKPSWFTARGNSPQETGRVTRAPSDTRRLVK